MHIVLANQWYPPESGWGGVAMYNHTIARAFSKLGHRVTVVAARYDEATPTMQEREGIRIVRLLVRDRHRWRRLPGLGRYVRPIHQFLYSWRVDRVLRELYSQDPFDVVEFAEVNAEGFCYLHRPLTPTVVRCHTPTFVLRDYYTPAEMPFDTAWTARMEQACIRRADALTAPSHDMARTIATRMGFPVERFTVIPNAVPDEFFLAQPQSSNRRLVASSPRPITVLHVGRLDRTKGIEVLARAIPHVVRECPNVRFVYVGDDRPTGDGDTWRQRLTRYFEQEGVADHVTFTGPVDQPTLLDWYRRADIAVVPSLLYESFSYTVAQAMAAGLPVVASRIGGIPETLHDAGILMENNVSWDLATAIKRLLIDATLCESFGQKAAQRALTHFQASGVAWQTLSIYQELRLS